MYYKLLYDIAATKQGCFSGMHEACFLLPLICQASGPVALGSEDPHQARVPLSQSHQEQFALTRTEAIKLFVLVQSKWPTENLFVLLYVFMVNVFGDPCYKVNHNYFSKHVTVVKQNCIFLDIYITSLKLSEQNLKKKKRLLPKHFS